MGSQRSKSCEQVCTDICQQTTANPAVFLHLSISLFPEQWVSTTKSSIQKEGGRKGNKKEENPIKQSPARNPVPQTSLNEKKPSFSSSILQPHMPNQLNATLQLPLHIAHLRLERHILHSQPLHNSPRRPIAPQSLDAVAQARRSKRRVLVPDKTALLGRRERSRRSHNSPLM